MGQLCASSQELNRARVRLWPIADVETCLSTGRLLLRQSHFQFPRERSDVIDGNRGDTKAFTDLHPIREMRIS